MSSNVSYNSWFILLLIEKTITLNISACWLGQKNVDSEAIKSKYLFHLILYGHLKNSFLIFGLSAGPARLLNAEFCLQLNFSSALICTSLLRKEKHNSPIFEGLAQKIFSYSFSNHGFKISFEKYRSQKS